ncbi:MAG TPA: ribosomal protein S18-alanine N-acetyltransferase [Candidatus Binatia bacterium]|nr:ribosomal protein S18-alanine N-acetyltransferase [Candidatus Binatia bacterium]
MGVRSDALVSVAVHRRSGGAPLALVFDAMVRRDLPAVSELERKAFSHPWSPEVFLRELRLPFSKIVLARIAAEPRGAVVGYLCRWLAAGVLEIQNVAVHPDWRRRSIGRRLVEHALTEGSQLGARAALLEVRRYNSPAISLYRGLGFRETGVRQRYYADGEDALLMELRFDRDGG